MQFKKQKVREARAHARWKEEIYHEFEEGRLIEPNKEPSMKVELIEAQLY